MGSAGKVPSWHFSPDWPEDRKESLLSVPDVVRSISPPTSIRRTGDRTALKSVQSPLICTGRVVAPKLPLAMPTKRACRFVLELICRTDHPQCTDQARQVAGVQSFHLLVIFDGRHTVQKSCDDRDDGTLWSHKRRAASPCREPELLLV